MATTRDLQIRLQQAGFDPGPADDKWGSRTRGALMASMLASPEPLADADYRRAADLLNVPLAAIRAVVAVESSGRGVHEDSHLPIILYEPHVFHRLTGGKFSAKHPDISYPSWGHRPYPKEQAARYDQLMRACALDWETALQSASWGAFQAMGFNFKDSGECDVWSFVQRMRTLPGQLIAFCHLIKAWKLDVAMREQRWAAFALKYNGKGYARNAYDQKLKAAYQKWAALA